MAQLQYIPQQLFFYLLVLFSISFLVPHPSLQTSYYTTVFLARVVVLWFDAGRQAIVLSLELRCPSSKNRSRSRLRLVRDSFAAKKPSVKPNLTVVECSRPPIPRILNRRKGLRRIFMRRTMVQHLSQTKTIDRSHKKYSR